MTTFTINNKEYTHNELNTMYDFFTDEQWNIITSALDEYRQSGEVVGVDVQPIKDIREVMFELFRGAY